MPDGSKRYGLFHPGSVGHVRFGCRSCAGCRADRASRWVTRIEHELACHDPFTCWAVHLTYDREHLPEGGSLRRRDVQLWLKRLRFAAGRLRYYGVGEYGTKGKRPHYHAILMGLDLPDAVQVSQREGRALFESKVLASSWGLGRYELSRVDHGAIASYVAGYVQKETVLQHDGGRKVIIGGRRVVAPFNFMSTHPGLGAAWFERYFASDVRPHLAVIGRDGVSKAIPGYYRKLLEKRDPEDAKRLTEELIARALARSNIDDESPERLKVRERVAVAARAQRRSEGQLDD